VIGRWTLEVLSPLDERKKLLELEVQDEAVSTSSVGPRRFVHHAYKELRADHIVDPRTGRARAAILSVTAVCPSAEAADALTTALVVLGQEGALRIAPRFGARLVVFTGSDEVPRVLDVERGTWLPAPPR